MDSVKILEKHPLFDQVEEEALGRLLSAAEELSAPRETAIYTPQRFRRCLGVLLTGRVQVSKEALVVSVLSAGDVFGAAALFTDSPEYATTLTALTDCIFVLVPQEAVSLLLQESARFVENYVRYLSGRIQFLSSRLDAVTAGSADRKLSLYLLSATDETGRLTISATQLSNRIGVGRATLYRSFELLEKAGAILRDGKTIHILDRTKLA